MRLKVQKLRLKAGITQQELADKLGVSLSAVKKWESAGENDGEYRPTRIPGTAKLKDLAKALGVGIEELF